MTRSASLKVLCDLSDIPNEGSKGVLPNARGRDRAFIVRKGGKIYAYVNTCPHYGRTQMAWKKDEFLNGAGDKIMCASHGALFDIEDGECVLGPCLGQALQRIKVTIEDGKVIGEVDPELRD